MSRGILDRGVIISFHISPSFVLEDILEIALV
jgi:hypothetical protein